jgi:hypothetical protein
LLCFLSGGQQPRTRQQALVVLVLERCELGWLLSDTIANLNPSMMRPDLPTL